MTHFCLPVFVDGGIAGIKHAGIAAIARSPEGYFLGWASRQMPRMTNNEAEYHATLLGLQLAQDLGYSEVEIISDSEVIVRQMRGFSRVNSKRLQELHKKTCTAVTQFKQVTFRHIPRTANCLADALATEAINGRTVSMPPATTKTSWKWFKK